MTLEELALSKKIVVCPQCLNEFLAQNVDIPASMLRRAAPASRTSRQLFCHYCGESLPVAGLKFCPYCGASQNLAAAAAEAKQEKSIPQEPKSPKPKSDAIPSSKENKTATEDDAYDKMSHLPFIRPMPRMRTKREVMGSPLLRIVCYIIIFILIALFLFVLYLSNFDEDGKVARSIGLNF